MSLTRSLLLAALVASSAGFAAVQPAAADSGSLTVQIRHGDRYDRYDRYDRGHRYGHRHWRNRHRCYTDVDYRYRWGHRVRIVERICFNRYGRRYVADRRVYRIGWRY